MSPASPTHDRRELEPVAAWRWRAVRQYGRRVEVGRAPSPSPLPTPSPSPSPSPLWRWDARERKMVPAQHLHAGGCTTFVRAWQLGARARTRTLLAVAVERTMVGGAAGSDGAAKFEYAANVSIFEWSAHARG